jgi:hypothetical protein
MQGQSCPKVTYTTPNATIKSLVAAVNCLSGASEPTAKPAAGSEKHDVAIESFQIIGPKRSRAYRKLVFAVLIVPVAGSTQAVAVTPENPESSITGTGGGQCKIKINPDKTVDGVCNLTGGTMFVAYRD